MLSAFTYRFYENALRFARWLGGWRTAVLVPVALTMCIAAVMVPIAVFNRSLVAQASAAAKVQVHALAPAPGQPDPTSLWRSAPIPAVAAAAKAALRNAPLPRAIVPSAQELEQENASGGGIVPSDCLPAFGSGATGKICRLGDTSSRRVLVLLGDSQAGTWAPALVAYARTQHLAVVPLLKPGCFVNRVHKNLPGWPCADWYRWALAHDRSLHPVATIVIFLMNTPLQQHPGSTVSDMRGVLSDVRNGVLVADQPSQTTQPDTCIYRPGATTGECSARVPTTYAPLMKAMAIMTAQTHHPAIPTEQWFCAGGICPIVINHTLTVRDLDHMTRQYSAELGPLFSLELDPILARLER